MWPSLTGERFAGRGCPPPEVAPALGDPAGALGAGPLRPDAGGLPAAGTDGVAPDATAPERAGLAAGWATPVGGAVATGAPLAPGAAATVAGGWAASPPGDTGPAAGSPALEATVDFVAA